jgi:hypothetical protein
MGRSLKQLTLEFTGCDVTGEDFAHILEAVAGNETLEALDLDISDGRECSRCLSFRARAESDTQEIGSVPGM